MKATDSSLLSSLPPTATPTHDILSIINEECDRLNRLVEEAGEMAKLEAGEIALDIEPVAVEEIIQAALGHCGASLGGRPLDVRIAEHVPPARADLERAKEALVQLSNNANPYSAKDQPITITAE